MNIFVFGLSYRMRKNDLASIFEPFGVVQNARIILDKETRRSKGYGFVEMDETQGLEAIKAIDGSEHFGRTIHCAVGNERPEPHAEAAKPADSEENSGPEFF